jgi:hypothetical protein
MTVTIADKKVFNFTYQEPTMNIVLIDLSPLETPLESWTYARNLTAHAQTWTSPKNGGFNAAAVLNLAEPGSTNTLTYLAAAQVTGEVSTPLNSFVKGDMLFVDLSNGLGARIGLIIILGLIGIWVGALILEHRITRPRPRKKRTETR